MPKTIPEPSEVLREVASKLRKLAIAQNSLLPIAEKLEVIAQRQQEYEERQHAKD